MKKLKTTTKGMLPQGSSMPMDFWNYNINPILGYRYKPELEKKK